MAEILAETEIRDRFVITVPSVVRDILNLYVDSRIRFERNDAGDICICKVVSHKVNSRFGDDVAKAD